MKILITGAAGFIGFHLAKRMLDQSHQVIGMDNLNDYYDPGLKEARLAILDQYDHFTFHKADLKNKGDVDSVFTRHQPTHVVNLAAQAGVRHSIENPYAYVDANVVGFMNLLEACRHHPVTHLLYASSSSVYGGNKTVPFSTSHHVDHPVSLYAATKKSNELMAHAYSHLYGIPTTGLRFFTVYGPYGRPDMAYFSFTKDILAGTPIKVFNHGKMERDFTYIDDIVEAVGKLIDKVPAGSKEWDESKDSISTSFAPYRIYNIGNHNPVPLMRFINALEAALGKEAEKIYMDMQPGDVHRTYADVSDLAAEIGFQPSTSIEEGIQQFVDWYKGYYKVKE